MPYIDKENRKFYDDEVVKIVLALQQNKHPGELNYVVTKICNGFLVDRHSYTNFNEVIGVLECAKQELIRRMLNPYEDKKCFENGDVYDI